MNIKIDGFRYELDLENKTADLYGYEHKKTCVDLVLESKIEHEGEIYTVESIYRQTFQGCDNLTTVVIPEGYVDFDEWIFFCCDKLKKITFPGSLKKLGRSSFYHCTSIEEVICGKGVTMSTLNQIFDQSENLKYINLHQDDIFRNKAVIEYVFNYIAENPEQYDVDKTKAGFKKKKDLLLILLQKYNTKILTYLFDNKICSYDVVKEFFDENEMDTECKALFLNYLNNATPEEKKDLKKKVTKKEDIEIGLESCSLKDIKSLWKCAKKDNKIYFKAYTGAAKTTTIPASIDGISDYVIEPLQKNDVLTELIFAEGVKGIEFETGSLKQSIFTRGSKSTFYQCSNMSKIVLPQTLNHLDIKFYIGRDISFVTNGDIDELLYLGTVLVSLGKSDVEKFVVKDGTTAIQLLNTNRYTKLQSIEIPQSVKSLGTNSFYGCELLEEINIPNDITVIGTNLFSNCKTLSSLQLPNSVLRIEDGAFECCYVLDDINIPRSVEYIGTDAFKFSDINKVDIPSGVKNICVGTFSNCENLMEVNLPNTIETIGAEAFSHCDILSSINIPSSVTSIDTYAFSSCEKLASVTFEDGINLERISWGVFGWCHSLDNVVLPEGLSSIGESAFEGCIALSNITIPSSVTKINKKAFTNCKALKNRPKI